jgi:hypothetical protein
MNRSVAIIAIRFFQRWLARARVEQRLDDCGPAGTHRRSCGPTHRQDPSCSPDPRWPGRSGKSSFRSAGTLSLVSKRADQDEQSRQPAFVIRTLQQAAGLRLRSAPMKRLAILLWSGTTTPRNLSPSAYSPSPALKNVRIERRLFPRCFFRKALFRSYERSVGRSA